jgi:hypothetical protein
LLTLHRDARNLAGDFMRESGSYPPAEESLVCLQRSGWSTGLVVFVGPSGKVIWRVDGSNGENQIRVVGATLAEVWHCAVEAAAACGMLDGWPRPDPHA